MSENWQKRVYRRKIPNFHTKDEWHKLRMECLRRDKFTCLRCEKTSRQGMTAHHRIPRNEDGGDNIENLITLCSPCHDYVEINNLRTISDIIGSYEKETVKPKPQKTYTKDEDYSFTRPDWHRWVYGAGRNGI